MKRCWDIIAALSPGVSLSNIFSSKKFKTVMRFNTLNEWLDWQFSLHPRKMELGLTRIRAVAQRLNLLPPPFPVMTVAGTNGKGSSVIMLDAILTAAGYRVGRFTSPHLLRYNERICVANQEASDSQLCQVFQLIEEVRGDISLTFFEFCTLAAMLVFQQAQVDIAVLEVGLGGRLDAVNIFDAEVALITSIDIDHVDWLGENREQIGLEKAGILRAHRPAVCSDANPPQSLIQYAQQLKTPLYCLGRDFSYQKNQTNQTNLPTKQSQTWHWQAQSIPLNYKELPLPHDLLGDFQLQNAAGVLTAITLFNQTQKKIMISEQAIEQGLINANLPGRFQYLPGPITRIFDVAHNPLGAQVLAQMLDQTACQGQTHVVMGMLANKDTVGFVKNLQNHIDRWYIAPLNVKSSATTQDLVEDLLVLGITHFSSYTSITQAYQQALSQASKGDRIVITGSFHCVSEVLLAELK